VSRGYQPEIDGIRAIAVTSVIVFHGHILPLPGGFAGVDIFFVLSGYLITGILVSDMDLGRFSIWQFYERRIRRIFPALFFVLAVTSLAAWAMLNPPQLKAYSQSLLSVVVFLSNFLFAANSGYFAPSLEEAALLHTWSLAVEEQFYLLFPFLLLLLHRNLSRYLFAAVLALAVASLGLSLWGAVFKAQINFFFPLSRAWELLAGGLAALWRRDHGAQTQGGVAWLGLIAIGATLVLHSEKTPYPGLATLLPVLGTVALILFASPQTRVGRLLSSRPLVGIGLISYSAYLWHQPLFALARARAQDAPDWATMAGLAVITYAVAALTWVAVEQPFRRPQNRLLQSRKSLFVAAGLGTAFFIALGAAGIVTNGNDAVWRGLNPERAARLDVILAARVADGLPADNGPCRFNVTTLDQNARDRIADCAAQYGPAVVVLGDSHAIDVYAALTLLSDAPFLLGVTNGGCRPADTDAKCSYDDFADMAAQTPQAFAQVLFVQSGAYLLLGKDGSAANRQIFARTSQSQPLTGLDVNAARLADLADYLADLAQHVPVTWLASRIEPHISPNRVLAQDCKLPISLRIGQAEIFAALDAQAKVLAAARGLPYVPLALQPYDPATDFMTCADLYWSDGDHWSRSGVLRFGTRLLPYLPAAYR